MDFRQENFPNFVRFNDKKVQSLLGGIGSQRQFYNVSGSTFCSISMDCTNKLNFSLAFLLKIFCLSIFAFNFRMAPRCIHRNEFWQSHYPLEILPSVNHPPTPPTSHQYSHAAIKLEKMVEFFQI